MCAFADAVWGIAAVFKIQAATFSMATGDIVSSISPYSAIAPVFSSLKKMIQPWQFVYFMILVAAIGKSFSD